MELLQISVVKHHTQDDDGLQSSWRAFSSSYKIIQRPDFQFPVNFKFFQHFVWDKKNLDSRLHEYPDAKKMTEIRWYPVVSVAKGWPALIMSWCCFPDCLPHNPLWHSVTLNCPAGCEFFIFWCQVSLIPPPVRQISRGRFTYWAVFFFSNQRWPPSYYHQQIYREGGRSIPSILWVLVDGIPQNLQQTFSSELCVVTWKICIF